MNKKLKRTEFIQDRKFCYHFFFIKGT